LSEKIEVKKMSLQEINKYNVLLEASTAIIIFFDSKGRICEVNKRVLQILGYKPVEIINHRITDLVHPEYQEKAQEYLKEVFTGEISENKELIMMHKNGKMVSVKVNCSGLKDEDGNCNGALCIIDDLSDRKKLEEQLIVSQKMEAVGRLAGGIAHDFNNMLTVILGYSEFLLDFLKEDDFLRSQVEEIKMAGERASSLTHQLLVFSRKQVVQPKKINLNQIIKKMYGMIQRLIGEDIKLIIDLEPEMGQIRADPGQIEQVIMNLVVNARDAMPKGGRLTIETGSIFLDEEYAEQHIDLQTGLYAMMVMTDNGTGMDEETMSHIFEPFFTTKSGDKGTGLGLATVYGIVKQSGGHIWVYSELGQGSTFKIYFPLVDGETKSKTSAREGKETLKGSETILLVEDEEVVRDMVYQTLVYYGYKVLEGKAPEEVMNILSNYREPIHLLITDVVLPQIRGHELARHVSVICPQIKVLYISGYTEKVILQNEINEHKGSYLQKPFTPRMLIKKIRELLDLPARSTRN